MKKSKPYPPAEYLRECLSYDRLSGDLKWKTRPRSHFSSDHAYAVHKKRCAGNFADSLRSDDYMDVNLDGRALRSHRAAWKMETGADPVNEIDHINGTKYDNRWANLREATSGENLRNRGVCVSNRLGVKGVRQLGKHRFTAHITEDGRFKYLGSFKTIEEAKAAYDKAAKELHGEFFHTT
jgi:hypothetical protein